MEKNWDLRAIIVAVRDMDKAVKHYESIGITGFAPESLVDRRGDYKELTLLRPQDLDATVKLRKTELGPIFFELLQPVQGES